MENYEEKYKQALLRAKECHTDGLALHQPVKEVIEHIFPELKEIGDERMWKLIKKYAHSNISDTVLNADHITREQLESWLEKQEEQQLADKNKPKFKAGDWIISNDNSRLLRRIIAVDESGYGYMTDCGYRDHSYYDNNFHLWTIQDTKDGDVLVCEGKISKNKDGQEIGIVKKYVGRIGGCDNCFKTYCFIDWERNFIVDKDMGSSNIHPATKEQRDLLFQKMKEEGYEWNTEKKELKKIESESTRNA